MSQNGFQNEGQVPLEGPELQRRGFFLATVEKNDLIGHFLVFQK